MAKIKTNERELAGKVAQWFNEHIDRNKFEFTSASNEVGVKTTKTHFGDVVIWRNRESNDAYAHFELKIPFAAENTETFKEKAVGFGGKFSFTWDFQNLNIYKVADGRVILMDSHPTPILNEIDEWLRGDKQAEIKAWIRRICDELVQLSETGKLSRFKPEKVYFVNLIRDVVNKLVPEFEIFIKDKHNKGINKKEIDKYVIQQGIVFQKDAGHYNLIARQRVYGLVTKIIFYLAVKRYFKELPDLIDTDEEDLNYALKAAFAEAAKRDWQAVFLQDAIEELGIPANAQFTLREFFKELKVYHFGELKEDVIGELFEEIIDPHERHNLGQYFTPEDLVDFVIGTIVNNKDGVYADPTCGSGTFLIRLYDRLKYLSNHRKSHADLLEQIWGVDIAKFPAELSTINLFRQEVSNFENFPRVINKSIFEIHKGFSTEFPPPNAGLEYNKIPVTIPEINGFVGNFPFIRQELIEKKDRGFKDELTKLLAEEYFFTYSRLFQTKDIDKELTEHLKAMPAEKRLKELRRLVEEKKISLRLSGQADIYAYIYIHLATLLAEKGSFAIITSNSWLDAAYGSVLKDFLLDHFHIKMIVASWAEPWFEEAAVNTIITVIEKRNGSSGKENDVKFVKLKKRFEELIPYRDLKLEAMKRWRCVDAMVSTIENSIYDKKCRKISETISELDNEEMRIRIIKQGELAKEVNEKAETSKWGKYLRAPKVYFEILEAGKDKLVSLKALAEVRFGIKTGINEFFYLEPMKILSKDNLAYMNMASEPSVDYLKPNAIVECRNQRGWQGPIESKYLKKVIKSPKEAEGINIDENKLKYFIFICNKSKSQLKKEGDLFALSYIEWGEKQKTREGQNTTAGISWKQVSSVQGRTNWFDLGINKFPDFIFPCGIGDTFKVFDNSVQILNDKRLYEVYTKNTSLLPLLNSTLFALFVESEARVSLGDGLLDLAVYEVTEAKIVNPLKLDENIKNLLEKKLKKISNRKINSVFDEVLRKDRKELDAVVLDALGLDEKEYLPRIYEGLCEMVRERMELPKMRKRQKKEKEQFGYDEVKQSVTIEIIPKGVRKFPEEFFDDNYGKITFDSYTTTGLPLQTNAFFNKIELKDESGKLVFTVDSQVKAKFALTLAKPDVFQLRIPKEEKVCQMILKAYTQYKSQLKTALETNAQQKVHDWNLAGKMADEIMAEYGLI